MFVTFLVFFFDKTPWPGRAALVWCTNPHCDHQHLRELQRAEGHKAAECVMVQGVRPADPQAVRLN